MTTKTVRITVKPNARASQLEELPDGTSRARLRSPPRDGKANEELISLLARHFGVAWSEVAINSGRSARVKRVELPD